jgi:hypothetical protein
MGPPVIAGNTVSWTGLAGGPTFGSPIMTFGPPPFDVVGVNGLPAASFTGFPMTVLP